MARTRQGPWRLSLYAGRAAQASVAPTKPDREVGGWARAAAPGPRRTPDPCSKRGKQPVADTAYPVTPQPLARHKHKCHTGADASDCGTVRQVTEYERQSGSVFPANARIHVSMVEHVNCLFVQ